MKRGRAIWPRGPAGLILAAAAAGLLFSGATREPPPVVAQTGAEFLIGIVGNLVASVLYDSAKAHPALASIVSPKDNKAAAKFETAGDEVHADVGDAFQINVSLDFSNHYPLASGIHYFSYWWEIYIDGKRILSQQIGDEIKESDGSLDQPIKKSIYFLASGLKGNEATAPAPENCLTVSRSTVMVKSFVQDYYYHPIWENGRFIEVQTTTTHTADAAATIIVNVHNPWQIEITQYPTFSSPTLFDHHSAAGTTQLKYTLRHAHADFGAHVGSEPRSLYLDSRLDVQAPDQSKHFRPQSRDGISAPPADPKQPPTPLAFDRSLAFSQSVEFGATVAHHTPPTSDISTTWVFNALVHGERAPDPGNQAKVQQWQATPRLIDNRPSSRGSQAETCAPFSWSVVDRDVQPTPTPGTTREVG